MVDSPTRLGYDCETCHNRAPKEQLQQIEITRSILGIAAGAERIGSAFADSLYAPQEQDGHNDETIEQTWRSIRTRLALHTLRRLVRFEVGRGQI